MLVAYKGRYVNGRFVLPGLEEASIPDNVNIIITILDDVPEDIQAEALSEKQVAARKFLKAMQALRQKGFSEETRAGIKTDMLPPPMMKTRGWKFSREEANER